MFAVPVLRDWWLELLVLVLKRKEDPERAIYYFLDLWRGEREPERVLYYFLDPLEIFEFCAENLRLKDEQVGPFPVFTPLDLMVFKPITKTISCALWSWLLLWLRRCGLNGVPPNIQ